jgi:hypothetical protein
MTPILTHHLQRYSTVAETIDLHQHRILSKWEDDIVM